MGHFFRLFKAKEWNTNCGAIIQEASIHFRPTCKFADFNPSSMTRVPTFIIPEIWNCNLTHKVVSRLFRDARKMTDRAVRAERFCAISWNTTSAAFLFPSSKRLVMTTLRVFLRWKVWHFEKVLQVGYFWDFIFKVCFYAIRDYNFIT